LVGKDAEAKTRAIQQAYLPNAILAFSEKETKSIPILQDKTPDLEGNSLIYVCFDQACRKPVSSLEEVISQLPYLS